MKKTMSVSDLLRNVQMVESEKITGYQLERVLFREAPISSLLQVVQILHPSYERAIVVSVLAHRGARSALPVFLADLDRDETRGGALESMLTLAGLTLTRDGKPWEKLANKDIENRLLLIAQDPQNYQLLSTIALIFCAIDAKDTTPFLRSLLDINDDMLLSNVVFTLGYLGDYESLDLFKKIRDQIKGTSYQEKVDNAIERLTRQVVAD